MNNRGTKMARAGVPRRRILRVRIQDSVMKFGYARTFANRPGGEMPAPPREKPTPALPRPPACRVRSGPIGKCIFRLLGDFRIWFGYLERRQATHNRLLGIRWASQECSLSFDRRCLYDNGREGHSRVSLGSGRCLLGRISDLEPKWPKVSKANCLTSCGFWLRRRACCRSASC